jgi:hypothetical protein
MVQLKTFYTINLSTVTFGLCSCIILLLAHVDYNYFLFLGCHVHYPACIFIEKAKHRSRFHFEFLTTFGTLDITFAIQISVMLTHAQTFFRGVVLVGLLAVNACAYLINNKVMLVDVSH